VTVIPETLIVFVTYLLTHLFTLYSIIKGTPSFQRHILANVRFMGTENAQAIAADNAV